MIKRLCQFDLNCISISCEDEVKLCVVTINFKLNFNLQISNIYKKAERQLNVLNRFRKHLNKLS